MNPYKHIKTTWEAVLLAHGKSNNLVYENKIDVITGDDVEGDVASVITTIGSIHVVFHGSNDKQDWLRNFDAHFISDGSYIHGFYKGFMELRGRINTLLEEMPGLPVVVSGYSRGGPIAMYFWEWMMKYYPREMCCITFASARHRAKRLCKKDPAVLNVVNKRDVVPKVPHRNTGHYGNVLYIGQETWKEKIARWYKAYKLRKANPFEFVKAIGKGIGEQHNYVMYERLMKEQEII